MTYQSITWFYKMGYAMIDSSNKVYFLVQIDTVS